ncbi:MAG: nickel pincer cofactor biosynthesis protein LarC [Chitinispirillaceae bacterium]|nr:nickel pincer cofactor biosynthesis protein LarC [Chitinispirillaceae bacterium]
MEKILYFDLLSGASGDMILAGLVDLGIPVAFINKELRRLAISGLSIRASRVYRNGIRCCRLNMKWDTPKSYRHLPDILRLIRKAKFSPSVRERSEEVLERIAVAEAHAHGIPKDHVHFHEIGAVDTIVDIVGVCLALDYLHIDTVVFSTLTEGQGTIATEHGVMPVPAPATAALIRGLHVTRLPIPTELLTPTGAALLTTLGRQERTCPSGFMKGSGNGCGAKEFKDHPNFLRVLIIETEERTTVKGAGRVMVLQSEMDHISGEIMGSVAALLMEKGALDVSWTPIYMKKGRPGYRLTVIASLPEASRLTDLVMFHTRTLGVRVQTVGRVTADRERRQGKLAGQVVSEKRCLYKGIGFIKAEHDDLEAIANTKGIPVIDVAQRYIRERKDVR